MNNKILFLTMFVAHLSYANPPILEGESNFDHEMVQSAIILIKDTGPDGKIICSNVDKIVTKIIHQKIAVNQNIYSEELWKLYGCDDIKYVVATLYPSRLVGVTETTNSVSKYRERNPNETSRILDQHKGAIYQLYNRALRQNPTLEGKITIKLEIDHLGKVVEAAIVSSELKDAELESAILRRVRMITFPPSNVSGTTINQTFDFLPQ
jgi:hypothetical protein